MATAPRFVVRPGVDHNEVDGQLKIVDEEGREHVGSSRTEVALWHRLVEGATMDELVDTLVDSLGFDSDSAEQEVQQVLVTLSERNLIERARDA